MVEKILSLQNISLVDFLGVEDRNIREIALSFPNSKIFARGNEIHIQGSTPEILHINEILNLLLEHYHRYGVVSVEDVRGYIAQDVSLIRLKSHPQGDSLLFGAHGMPIKPKTANQRTLVEAAENNDIVFALGPAGTGKTYVAVALAVRALKNKQVKRIIITRPAVEAGEHLGFLPGDMKEKIDPYLRPIYDALADMIPAEKLKFYQDTNVIEIAPMAFMRGRTLSNAFILLDEAQNTTAMQIKMFLTRMGQDSKMIITGDISQIDLPRNVRSGLVEATRILQEVKGIAFVRLEGKDVIRHRLVRSIISAYEKDEHRQKMPKAEVPQEATPDKVRTENQAENLTNKSDETP
ncbi:PhoH family protein [Hugenholtzia roseola]|uniref:PhoH family protein n=1 Tax=Hugenholtzia roseola TaxID=1002 RepID=UPI0004274233|nr:PhoH family protein [Hugenholtzia roseola]